MSRLRCIVAVCAVVSMTNCVLGGENEANRVLRLTVDLSDGSRIIGIPAISSVPLQASYAKMDIPPEQIGNIKIEADHARMAIEMVNGDKLSGVVSLGPIELTTIFGTVIVGIEHLTTIRVLSGRISDGIVLHYTFDNDEGGRVEDESGHVNDGYWVGAPLYEAGIKGMAAHFRSKDTYVVSPSQRLNMNRWNGMTVSLWVSVVRHTQYGHVINRGPLSTEKQAAFELAVGHGYGRGLFVVQNSPTTSCPSVIAGPGNLPLNSWCHLAGTYDGEMLRYYVDGKQEKETRISDPHAPIWDGTDTNLVIGNMSRLPFVNWTDMFFNGLVDEVYVFDRALSETEIRQLHDLRK